RGIDTACQPKHYNEAGVGEALSRLDDNGIKRESLFIQTKFTPLSGQDPDKIPYDPDAPIEEQVLQSFATSLKNLKTDYLDSLVLHSPLFPHVKLMKAWKTMESIHEKGGAQLLGISNCYDLSVLKKLQEDSTVKPAIVQNRFYEETSYDSELRNWCTQNGIIYQSFWTLTANPHILTHNAFQNLCQRYNRTSPQVFFRYLNQIKIVPLTGTCSIHHMQEDLSIFDFTIVQEDIEVINLILRLH
ncbi:MAG: aldo/keto reductase, partial [Nitrospinae bacterium]|nr:aldo/keto reductase [Nitrospinota bacterium]